VSKSYEGWSEEKIIAHREKNRQRAAWERKHCKEKVREKKRRERKKNKAKRLDFKKLCVDYKGGACLDCGVKDHPCIYDFHHRNPRGKKWNLSNMRGYLKLTPAVKAELDKCDILCSNCHRKRHVK
jgi:hypothetical protein